MWAHAQASTAVVTLSFLGTEVTMDIYDDGAGFDPLGLAGPCADGTGYGLTSLRERRGRPARAAGHRVCPG